ncbi:MAG: nucleotidyltransferase domain-containing protein [Synechococcus sp. SB0675_bin_7]|nr:nucleotidyltransferase domain-containing protein [Synechococcus sp. SB0675_bin_7]
MLPWQDFTPHWKPTARHERRPQSPAPGRHHRPLAANHRVEKAVLFGSQAMGANTVTSDVDIALFGPQLDVDGSGKAGRRL